MTQTITASFPNGLGKSGSADKPVSFSFEYKSIEGFANDLRYALSRYNISDNSVVDLNTEKQTIRVDKGREGEGTYTITE